MQLCYVDESGDTGMFVADERNSQPVFVLCALLLDQTKLEDLTRRVIELKKRFFPALGQHTAHWHDWLKIELKGADIRRALRERNHRSTRPAMPWVFWKPSWSFSNTIPSALQHAFTSRNPAKLSTAPMFTPPPCSTLP